jgi:hypothetical protein
LRRERSNSENESRCSKELKHISMPIILGIKRRLEARGANEGDPLRGKTSNSNGDF